MIILLVHLGVVPWSSKQKIMSNKVSLGLYFSRQCFLFGEIFFLRAGRGGGEQELDREHTMAKQEKMENKSLASGLHIEELSVA